MKSAFFHALLAGFLAAIAAIVYSIIYSKLLLTDFSKLVNPISISAANLFSAAVISLAYFGFCKIAGTKREALFNGLLILFSMVSLAIPFSLSLPLDMQSPELFVGLTVPMHLFPALFWLGSKPMFSYIQ